MNPVVTVTQPLVLVKHPALTPERQPVRLTTDAGFDGQGTLSLAGGGAVRLFDAAVGGAEVRLDGAHNVFAGAALTAGVTLFAEGVRASGAMNDVRVVLSLAGGSKPTGPDAVGNLTAVELTVDIHQSRTDAAVAPAALSQADKVAAGRFVHLQFGDKHGRAMVTVRKARPHVFNGDLELRALDARVKLFDAERGGAEVPLPHTLANGPIPVAPDDGVTFWLEGAAVSGALRDTGLKLGLAGVDPEGDLARATVVRLRSLRTHIPATQPHTARMGNGPAARHTHTQAVAPAEGDYDRDFVANPPLVLVHGSLRAASPARLSVRVDPVGVPLRWDVHRDDRPAPDGDDAAVIAASPAAAPTLAQDGADPRKATLVADAVGSFHVRAFVDCNGSGRFDQGADLEPFIIQNVVLVGATVHRERSAAHATLVASPNGGGINVSGGVFNVATPNLAAMHMLAEVDLMGGGANGQRGLAQVFAGWVNNETRNENIAGTFVDRTVAPTVTMRSATVFASNSALATGGNANGRVFLPGDPAPSLVAPILLDTGRAPPGVGGDSACLTRSRIRSRANLAIGQRIVVESVDSPGDGDGPTHPGRPAARLERFHFGLDFQASLCIWVNRSGASGATGAPADRLYAVVLEVPWSMVGEWTITPATGAVAVAVAPAVTKGAARRHAPPKAVDAAAVEVRAPTGLNLLARDARA